VISGCLRRLDAADAEVHLVLTGDQTIRGLNRRFRGIDSETDVLSFPDGDILPSGRRFLGEIVISLDRARQQADRLGHGKHDSSDRNHEGYGHGMVQPG
jgi:probable rRNA maturation factor